MMNLEAYLHLQKLQSFIYNKSLLLLIMVVFLMACKNDGPKNGDAPNQVGEVDLGHLYTYYTANASTQEDLDQNKLIEYAADHNLEVFRTVSGVFVHKSHAVTEGDSIKWGDKLTVNYKGYFTNGNVFNSSFDSGKPITFRVGSMMNGWNEALMHLKRGEKATLLIPSHMAYGKRGFTDIIGPDEVLIFDIEILLD